MSGLSKSRIQRIVVNNAIQAQQASSAASATSAVSASYAVTASYALTSAGTVTNAISASYAATASLLLGSVVSASYALTASYAMNGGGGGTTTGSFTGSFTGSLLGTSSWATNAITASYVLSSSYSLSSSYALSSSIASTASFYGGSVTSASYAFSSTSASIAQTASYYGGNVTSASYAVSSSYSERTDKINVIINSSSATFYPVFVDDAGNRIPYLDGDFSYIPSTNTLSVNSLSGTASYALNGPFAGTGSNTFNNNQIISGSLTITQDLTVLGSASITNISQSTLNIGTNLITVNTNTPGVRFGGLSVIDSGSSPQRSGSILFDSTNDQWIFVHQSTSGAVTSSVFIQGPQTFNNIGNETNLTTNKIPKSTNAEHIGNSNITDTGTLVSINSNTQVTGSLTITQNISASSFTGSFTGDLIGTASWASNSISASFARTSSFINTLTQNVIITGSLTVTGSSEAWTGPPHNYKISGQWYSQAENATAYGTVAHATGSGTTNSIYMVPWVITRTQTFTSGAIENTLSNSLLNARFGLYRANPTSSLPQTLVYDSGDINLSGATVKTVSFASPITLTPGLYYTAFTVSGSSPTSTMRSLGVSAFAAVIGLTTPGGASNGSYINATRPWAVANANMAFPSDPSTLTLNYTVGAIYATWFRLQ